MYRFISFVFIMLSMVSCISSRDFWHYALAQNAMRRAHRTKAMEVNPGLYSKARSQFGMGVVAFQNKNYDKANEYFQKAQKLAEQAETLSFLKRSQGGVLY